MAWQFEETDQHRHTQARCGGCLIARIFQEGLDNLANVGTIDPSSPIIYEDDLRIWLQDNGFQIAAESILEEAGKFYILVQGSGTNELSASMSAFESIFV